MMRYLLLCLACLPAITVAQSKEDKPDQESFERRFRAADKNDDGRLSRTEAYAEFPRAPEFFREIDADNDGHVTLAEIARFRDRYLDAAYTASSIGGAAKYVRPEYIRDSRPVGGSEVAGRDMAYSIAQKRNNEFYELLGGDSDPYPDLPVVADPASNLMKKQF